MGHEILSEEKNCERWYQEELNKPLEEIKEDLFFRADNFAEEEWYEDVLLYTRIGICQPKKEHVETVQKALKILGFPTHAVCRGNKDCLVPGEKQRERQRNYEEKVANVNDGGMFMEVKINREIRDYTESMFFGLSLRQFFFSVIACGVAVGLYFLLHPYVGIETVSWMCVLGAAPFAALGFFKYHGMTAEQFVWAWIKSEILMPKRLVFRPENIYYEALKPTIEKHEKEELKRHD